jgi:ligand-binding sensor domain-containing protein
MRTKIFLAPVLFLLFAFCSYAQIPSKLVFSRITKKDGLASNMTFRTVRDKQGFLWIATQNGLQRYDASRFLTFRHLPGNGSSILENAINDMTAKKDCGWYSTKPSAYLTLPGSVLWKQKSMFPLI